MSGVDGGAPARDYAEAAQRAQRDIETTISGLRGLVQAEIDSRAEYERLVGESKQRERRLVKAIAALEGEPLGKPKPKPKPKLAAHQQVSADSAERVLAEMRRLIETTGGETVTRPQLVEAMKDSMSAETVRRGLILLRRQERIRQAGRDGRGQTATILYAVMPDGD